jgi:hypothetical protein
MYVTCIMQRNTLVSALRQCVRCRDGSAVVIQIHRTLTVLVSAVIIVFADGHTHVTILPQPSVKYTTLRR